MKTRSDQTLVQDLRELVAALDRRMPRIEREGARAIARDAQGRLMLETRGRHLGVDGSIFHNRFVSQAELTEFLSAADLLQARRGSWWDANRVGLSPPLIETSRGWLMLYHGVRRTAAGCLYRLGAVRSGDG